MKKIQLRYLSLEKQMTILLPCLMAMLVLIGILAVEKTRRDERVDTAQISSQTTKRDLRLPQEVSVLCVLREEETVFFSELTVGENGEVTAKPLSGLEQRYRKDGIVALKQIIGTSYYAGMTFEQLQELLQYCGEGVSVHAHRAISYTDEAGLSVSFPKGRLQLSANRTVDFLRGLALCGEGADMAAQLVADLFSRYGMQTDRISNIYAVFATLADTDIRIYDFERYLRILEGLAAQKTEG